MHFFLRSRYVLAIGMVGTLAACAGPSDKNITLAQPGVETSEKSEASNETFGLPLRPIRYARTKPGCTGTCPRIEVDSVSIDSEPKLTQLIDNVLAYMTGIDPDRSGSHRSLQEYEAFFWATAQARDLTVFKAKVRDANRDVIAVELTTGQYLTGAAHGIPATQFLNWTRSQSRVLALEDVLLSGSEPTYMAALQRAHTRWKLQLEDYQRDGAAFDRLWPFQPSKNFALTKEGIIVKYDAYAIAPYSSGQPELLIPYDEVIQILDKKWLPN